MFRGDNARSKIRSRYLRVLSKVASHDLRFKHFNRKDTACLMYLEPKKQQIRYKNIIKCQKGISKVQLMCFEVKIRRTKINADVMPLDVEVRQQRRSQRI